MPPRILPASTLHGINAIERGHESRFQPLALAVKRLTSLVDVQIFEEHAQGTLQQQKCRDQADGQDTSPDQPTHVPAPRHVPESTIRRLILESPTGSTQVKVATDLSTESGVGPVVLDRDSMQAWQAGGLWRGHVRTDDQGENFISRVQSPERNFSPVIAKCRIPGPRKTQRLYCRRSARVMLRGCE